MTVCSSVIRHASDVTVNVASFEDGCVRRVRDPILALDTKDTT